MHATALVRKDDKLENIDVMQSSLNAKGWNHSPRQSTAENVGPSMRLLYKNCMIQLATFAIVAPLSSLEIGRRPVPTIARASAVWSWIAFVWRERGCKNQ